MNPRDEADGQLPEEVQERLQVLIVDDNPAVRDVLREYLEAKGFEVEVAGDGEEAMEKIGSYIYDAIVLDLMLPGISGHEVTRSLRDEGVTTPVLMVTGADTEGVLSESLDSGSDDFIQKPFDFAEMEARLRALIRRSRYAGAFGAGGIRLDFRRQRATIGEAEIRLTKVEFLILDALIRARGDFVSREDLLRQVWQMDFDPGTNLVYTHVANLRNKLTEHGVDSIMEAERGKGYRVILG